MNRDEFRCLTAKERSFVEAYIGCLNGAEAVRQSAYKVAPSNASSFANKLLARAPVKAAIQGWQRKRALKVEVDADRWIEETARVAFLDPADVLNDDLTPKASLADMGDARRAIKGIKVRVEQRGKDDSRPPAEVIEVQFHDKLGALDKIAKHLGLYAEDRAKEQKVDLLAEIRARLDEAGGLAAPFPVSTASHAGPDAHQGPIEDAEVIVDDDAPRDPVTGEILP